MKRQLAFADIRDMPFVAVTDMSHDNLNGIHLFPFGSPRRKGNIHEPGKYSDYDQFPVHRHSSTQASTLLLSTRTKPRSIFWLCVSPPTA